MKFQSFLFSLLFLFSGTLAFSQTMLTGKVTDDYGQEELIGANVTLTKKGVMVKGAATDFHGDYRILLDSGTYTVEVSYTGFTTSRIENVVVLANQTTRLNVNLASGNVLQEVVVTASKVPVIQKEQTCMGMTLSSDQIRNVSGKSSGRRSKAGKANNARNAARSSSPVAYHTPTGKKQKTLSGKKKPDHSQPSDDFSREQYNAIVENPFQNAAQSNISTFSIDVDAASYANLRRYINDGSLPPKDAVRIEEMVNYFDYQYNRATGPHPFEVTTEVAPCPWEPQHRLLMVGLQGKTVDVGQLPASNLVFLIDVSGSMSEPDKLPLVQQSLSLLVDQLRPIDRVALVVYAGAAGLVLPSTPGTEKATIKAAINNLSAGGSTAGGAGIQLAYNTARSHFIPKGNNRVILCTDGDFNVGIASEDGLVKLIEKERESNIYLTVLGFGTGNYQDGKMQQLADKGNGNHGYIDGLKEAQKVLVREFGGTLFAIAKDVKLQLHFNPQQVAGYRLIGYENRLLATEDFHDDTKDAGEMGAGHRVTALYEIVPTGQPLPPLSKVDSALVVVAQPDKSVKISGDDLMVLQLRYKQPNGLKSSQLMEYHLNAAALDRRDESENFQLAAAVVEFGLLLRDSKFKGNASYASALHRARAAAALHDASGYRTELAGLIEAAGRMAGSAPGK